jgi:DNA-binding IclR family transcriptional regulator
MTRAKDQADPPKGQVPAVARAVRLLDTLAAAPRPMSLIELTEALGLPKSTVHGLCATLVHCGLAMRYEDGAYHLGVHVMDLAHAFLARSDLTADFLKILDEKRPMPEESIVLSVLDGADVVYVACRNGTRPFGFDFRIGMRLPANCAASGKALLSRQPAERVAALARDGTFYGLTSKSVTTLDALQKQLAVARKRGYAVDDEETRLGMVCFGAPVFSVATGEAIAAVGISMPKASLDRAQKERAIDEARDIATTLSRRLGAQ